MEACHSLGFAPEELHKKKLSYFKQTGGSLKLAERRMIRYEEKRVEAVEAVKAERERMIKKTKRLLEKKASNNSYSRPFVVYSKKK